MAVNLWELKWHSHESQVSSVQSRLPQWAGIKQTGATVLPEAMRQEHCSLEPVISGSVPLGCQTLSRTHSSLLQGRQMLSGLQKGIFQLNVWRNLPTVSMPMDIYQPISEVMRCPGHWFNRHLLNAFYVLGLALEKTEVNKAQARNSRSSQFNEEAEQETNRLLYTKQPKFI